MLSTRLQWDCVCVCERTWSLLGRGPFVVFSKVPNPSLGFNVDGFRFGKTGKEVNTRNRSHTSSLWVSWDFNLSWLTPPRLNCGLCYCPYGDKVNAWRMNLQLHSNHWAMKMGQRQWVNGTFLLIKYKPWVFSRDKTFLVTMTTRLAERWHKPISPKFIFVEYYDANFLFSPEKGLHNIVVRSTELPVNQRLTYTKWT